MTLLALSQLLLKSRADIHPFAYQNGKRIDFGQFRADVASVAGKVKNCRAALLMCEDSYNFAVGFFGLLHAGVTIILPPNTHQASLHNVEEAFDLFVDDKLILDKDAVEVELKMIDPTKFNLNFFTSGSTGKPKRISKNLAMLENEISVLHALWRERASDGTVFATVSHQHVYGLIFKLLWPISTGRPFMSELHSWWESLLSALTPHATIISSPAHLGRIEGLTPLPNSQAPNLIFTAGAPLTFTASQQCEAIFGCKPVEIFGSTETGALATRTPITGHEPWQLLPGLSLRADKDGKMVLKSPFAGPDWQSTEDLIEPTGDGFHFLGRTDRIVKIEGKRVSLIEVEQSLKGLELVKDATTIFLRDDGARLAAAVVLNQAGKELLQDMGHFRLSTYLRSKLAMSQDAASIPRLWRFIDQLPTEALGKQRHADICDLFKERK